MSENNKRYRMSTATEKEMELLCIDLEFLKKQELINFSLFDLLYKEIVIGFNKCEFGINKYNYDDFPLEETMNSVKEYLIEIKNVYNITLNREILGNAYFFGSSCREGDFKEYIIDLASSCSMNNDKETSYKLIRLVLRHEPKFYSALAQLEYNLIYDIKNQENVDEYINLLKKLIEIGSEQNKRVDNYKYSLDRYQRPARNQEYATSIAYFENSYSLKQRFPRAYVCCGHKRSVVVNSGTNTSNTSYGVEYVNSFMIEILLGPSYGQLPPNEVIIVDGFEVPVCFSSDRVEKL